MEMYSLPAYEQILSRYLLGINIGSAAFGILLYVFLSIGMYSIAKHRGIHKAWFAWFPVLRMWLLGCISDQYREVAKGQIIGKAGDSGSCTEAHLHFELRIDGIAYNPRYYIEEK